MGLVRSLGRASRALALVGGAAACNQPAPSGVFGDKVCDNAEARLGKRVCVHQVEDTQTWTSITFEAAAVDQARATTYMVPVGEQSRLAPLFVDATSFGDPEASLHFKFLTESFAEFENYEYPEYVDLIEPATREWYSGSVTEFLLPADERLFGFTVWDAADSASSITCEQFTTIYATLDERFDAGRLAVVPAHELQTQTLAECDLPVHDPSTSLDYELYTKAEGCGTLRRYTLSELTLAEQNAEFGFQDVLVVDQAPLDIQTIISGIVTGTRQGELSHLNVRSASRGTPNCYVKNAYELLAKWDGKLIKLECGPEEATVVEITPKEAQECWDRLVPEPADLVPADLDWTDLVPLLELPTATPQQRRLGVGRFGSKGANLGTLYQRIDPDIQLTGFLIPFHYYDAFMQANTWSVDLGNDPETITFAETLTRYLADEEFKTNGVVRRTRLDALQAAMDDAPCDPDLLAAIDAQIVATFGDDTTMVRFRSSSNAEDSLNFNGAGLYDSTSVCLADQNDVDAVGPSLCDPDQSSEREVCRGLRKVWQSLWNYKAYEEREWYSIDHSQVYMGILVNTRTKNEEANIVAFSGNPLKLKDYRYLINAQAGELAVVSALPGVWPEKDLLTVEDDGSVTLIERERGSTELPEGQWVLSDAELEQLGAALFDVVAAYPEVEGVKDTDWILFDTEWKMRAGGRLAIKQIRPFLGN